MSELRGNGRAWIAVAFTTAITLVVAFGLYTAFEYNPQARRFPILVAIPTVLLGVVQIGRDIRAARNPGLVDSEADTPNLPDVVAAERSEQVGELSREGSTAARAASMTGQEEAGAAPDPEADAELADQQFEGSSPAAAFGWLSLMVVIFLAVGLMAAVPIFLFVFMRFYGRESLKATLIAIAAVMAGIYGFFVVVLNIRLFEGPLLQWAFELVGR